MEFWTLPWEVQVYRAPGDGVYSSDGSQVQTHRQLQGREEIKTVFLCPAPGHIAHLKGASSLFRTGGRTVMLPVPTRQERPPGRATGGLAWMSCAGHWSTRAAWESPHKHSMVLTHLPQPVTVPRSQDVPAHHSNGPQHKDRGTLAPSLKQTTGDPSPLYPQNSLSLWDGW